MNVNPARLALYVGAASPTDPLMLMVAEQALAFLSRETHRYFGSPATRTEYLPGSGTHRLWLADDAIGTPAVKELWNATEEGVITDFVARGRLLTRLEGRQWSRRYDYEVTYTAGYHLLPADIEQAVFDLVRWKFESLKATPGMTSEKLGDYSYTRGDVDGSGASWVPKFNATIQSYRRNPV
jgi:hypothetical protein